jgi:hypothetical protein
MIIYYLIKEYKRPLEKLAKSLIKYRKILFKLIPSPYFYHHIWLKVSKNPIKTVIILFV